MSEKELKISELANIWAVSVPTTWNRVRKEDLKTVKKVDENRKEVNYVVISDEIINKYILTVNNNVNNRNYEDILTDNNVNEDIKNNENDIIDAEYTLSKTSQLSEVINTLTVASNSFNEKLITLYEDNYNRLQTLRKNYNDHLQELSKELIDYKSKALLLEDKADREGFYTNEINTLKKDNNLLLKGLITLLIMFIITFVSLVAIVLYHKAIEGNKDVSTTVENVSNPVQTQKKEVKPVKAQPLKR